MGETHNIAIMAAGAEGSVNIVGLLRHGSKNTQANPPEPNRDQAGQDDEKKALHIAVIGAGAEGVVCAIELLRRGHKITLIEPGPPGGDQAASYGNAGWLSSHSIIPPATPGAWKDVPKYLLDPTGPLSLRLSHLPRALPWLIRYLLSGWTEAKVFATATALRALLKDAPALHTALAAEAGLDALVEHKGVMNVYRDREAFAADAMGWRIRKALGVEWEEWEGEELRKREPQLANHYGFAIYVPEAGRCLDPGAYVAGLFAHAQKLGATFVQARGTGFKVKDGRVAAVSTDKGDMACDAVVIAAGIRSKTLCAELGDKIPLESERGYHVSIEGTSIGPNTSFMATDAKMVINSMRTGLRGAGQVEFAGLEAAPDWRRAQILRDHLFAMFPCLPGNLPADAVKFWMGNRPSMPDGRPCIGVSPKAGNVVYAFGHGHVGLVGSARTGRLVAQLISGEPTEIDLSSFDPRRF